MKQVINILLVLAVLAFLIGTLARFLSDGVLIGNEAVVYCPAFPSESVTKLAVCPGMAYHVPPPVSDIVPSANSLLPVPDTPVPPNTESRVTVNPWLRLTYAG